MNTKKKRENEALITKAVKMVNDAMKGMKRHDEVTPLSHHSLTVFLILRDLLRVQSTRTLVTGILHDIVEDTGEKKLDIEQEVEREFGAAIAARVAKQTHVYVSETAVPDPKQRRLLRYRKKLARVPAWDAHDCLVSLADILANLYQYDGSIDPVMLRKPPYWNWALREMLPALDQRLREQKWTGLMPSGLVMRHTRYCGPLPLFDRVELAHLDAIV